MLTDLLLRVEKLIAGHNMVVCLDLRLEAAVKDVLLLELVLVEAAEGLVAIGAMWASVLVCARGLGLALAMLGSLTYHNAKSDEERN